MFRGVGQGVRPCRIGYASSFVFGSCLWFLPPSAVEKSRSQKVEELGSQPSTRSFGLQLGETVGHSWTFRLVDFPAPELSERTGGTTPRNTKYYERSQYVFENTRSVWKTNSKRTQNEPQNELDFERQMHRLNPNSELSQARVRAGGLRLEMGRGTEAIRSRKPGASREKYKNNTNEASMLLKTKGAFGKRTQNEPKNKPNLVCLRREPMVCRFDHFSCSRARKASRTRPASQQASSTKPASSHWCLDLSSESR